MPRSARRHKLQGALVYHADNRGNWRRRIFHSPGDYFRFMDLLRDYGVSFLGNLYHWVIMPNHFHILFEIADPKKISAMMAGLALAYSRYYHRRYNTAGYLWQGRFQLQPVQAENYLRACGLYIERNPVRAGIAAQSHGYPYSSARWYCLGIDDGIIAPDPTYLAIGRDWSE